MLENLPEKVKKHVLFVLNCTDFAEIERVAANLCNGCPAKQPNEDEQSPCYDCPFWAARVDLTELRLLRDLGFASEMESDKA